MIQSLTNIKYFWNRLYVSGYKTKIDSFSVSIINQLALPCLSLKGTNTQHGGHMGKKCSN